MKKLYAISSRGKSLKSFMDVRFGKCESIVLYDAVKKDYAIIDNPFLGEEHSGSKLIDFLKKHGVVAVITGEVGPLVLDVMKKNKMQLILLEEERIKIEDIVAKIGLKQKAKKA